VNPLKIAFAVDPDAPVPALTLIIRLRRMLPDLTVVYPPDALPAQLAARWGEPPHRHLRTPPLTEVGWIEGADALAMPEWSPRFWGVVQHALASGIPVLGPAVNPDSARIPGVLYLPPLRSEELLIHQFADALEALQRARRSTIAAISDPDGGFVEAAFHHPAFYQPAFYQPAFQPDSIQPAFYQRAFYQPAFYQPAFYQPAFYQPAFNQRAFYQPASFQPASAHSTFYQPAFYQPEAIQPAFYQRAFYQPAFHQPAFYTPAFYQSAFYQPAIEASGHAQFTPQIPTDAASRMRLVRSWEPLTPRWEEPDQASLGIGIITCNRLSHVRWCVDALRQWTRAPFHLVIADDGSTDGAAAWARESGIPVVTGRNRGVAWNKNRALHWLMHRTACERILLIEDDIYPVRAGWEQGWLEALERFPHLNYSPKSAAPPWEQQVDTIDGYPVLNWVNAALMAMTRQAVNTVGFFDTRFEGYGYEHIELTARYVRAGLHPANGYLTFRDGSLSDHNVGGWDDRRLEEIARNGAIHWRILDEPVWRPPALGTQQAAALAREQQRGDWSAGASKPGAERVSVICASRTEALARRMAASLGEDPLVEFIWAWNGEGRPELPGAVIEYRERPFNYCEAYNEAARHATGRVLLIVNDDVEITCQGLPQRLLECYDEHADLGIIYGGIPGDWELLDAPEAPAWEGACWAIRREGFEAMGGLEEALDGYGADEYVATVRMLRLGSRGGRLAGWTYTHSSHQTYGTLLTFRRNIRQITASLGWEPNPRDDEEAAAHFMETAFDMMITAEGWPQLAGTWTVRPQDAVPPTHGFHPTAAGRNPSRRTFYSFYAPERSFYAPERSFYALATPVTRGVIGAESTGAPANGVRSRWVEPTSASLGIGVITHNRLEQLQRCVEALREYTNTPFHLVIADDGSTDGAAAWARADGIPVVTGENRGVAWNKNRAMYWLMHRTNCERILLIEDDVYPTRAGWERGWLAALEQFPHVNYSPAGAMTPELVVAHYSGYEALNWVGGALMALTRAAIETVGYLDTRFQGYGDEHVEYTERCQRAGLTPQPGYVTMRDGSVSAHPVLTSTASREADLARNRRLREALAQEEVQRPAARTAEEEQVLAAEQSEAAAQLASGR